MVESFYVDVVQVGAACISIILVGYLLSKFNVLQPTDFKNMNSFASKAAFPLLLFRSLASRKLREIQFSPLAVTLLMNASVQVILAVIFLFPFKDRLYLWLGTVISSVYINLIILGLPIFQSIWGKDYDQIPAICSFTHYILLVPVFTIFSQLWRIIKAKEEQGAENVDQKITWKDVLMAFVNALKTPLVIGNFAGLIWSAIGIPYPPYVNTIGQHLGNCVGVFALLGIGRFLHAHSIFADNKIQLIVCLLIRHFLCPTLAALWAAAIKVNNTTARQCVIIASLPAANAGFLLAEQAGISPDVASAMVFWSLIFIVPVLIFWFWIFDVLKLFPENLENVESP